MAILPNFTLFRRVHFGACWAIEIICKCILWHIVNYARNAMFIGRMIARIDHILLVFGT